MTKKPDAFNFMTKIYALISVTGIIYLVLLNLQEYTHIGVSIIDIRPRGLFGGVPIVLGINIYIIATLAYIYAYVKIRNNHSFKQRPDKKLIKGVVTYIIILISIAFVYMITSSIMAHYAIRSYSDYKIR